VGAASQWLRSVEVLASGTAFEVEFSGRNMHTYESIALRLYQIMMLRFDPVSSDSTPEVTTV